MTTLICDFQSIIGEKIKGYATLTAGKVRPSYNSPAVVVHEPTKQAVTQGQTTFENVNPGDAVITVEWADQTQSATIRFVVPESEAPIYLADCLSADSLDPEEIELLRWGIRENLSGAREMLETAKNLGLTEINGTVEAYFTEAAEILRKALEAAQLAEQYLGTIDGKVEATEGVVTDVDQAKQQIQDLLDEIAALELEMEGTNADLAGAVETINTLSPQVSAAAQAASEATQKAQNAVSELNTTQSANAAEFNTIKQDLGTAVQTAKQATDAVAASNQQLGIEVQRILSEVDTALTTATEATAQARIANENLETYQYQLGEIQQEQGHILSQQAEIVGSFDSQIAEIERLSTEISTANSELETISGEQSALVTEMNTQVGSLQELTATQGAAITAAKSRADKGVTDAAAASSALATYKGVNDPKVTKAQSDATKGINAAAAAKSAADQAALDATNKSAAAKTAAEDYAREAAEAAQAQAEENAAAEALRVAQAEATAAKNAAATDAQTKADEAERLAKVYAAAQAKSAKEQAEANAAADASTKANKAKTDAQAAAKVLSDKAQQAAVAAQTSIDNLEIGGRNLILNSAGTGTPLPIRSNHVGEYPLTQGEDDTGAWLQGWHVAENTWFISAYVNQTYDAGSGTYYSPDFLNLTGDYTQSFEVMCDVGIRVGISRGEAKTLVPGEWTRLTVTQNKADGRARPLGFEVGFNQPVEVPEGTKLYHRHWKIEAGNKATDWTPAPEDVIADIAKAQAEAELARAEATSKSDAARVAAELYAKEKSEADTAASLVTSAAEALRVAKLQADAAKAAASTDAKAKADEAERLAKVYAAAQASAAKEGAEATAALDASTKANKAKTDAEAKAATLATAAQNAAATALSTYKGQNDPKVTKAQQDATKGINNAATALAKANEANNKLPAITSDVSAAAQTALDAVNALPGIRTDITAAKSQADKGVTDAATAKARADKGVQDAAAAKSRADKGVTDAATAKSAADTAQQRADKGVTDAATAKQVAEQVGTDLENLEIGGRNLLLDSLSIHLDGSDYRTRVTQTRISGGTRIEVTGTGTWNTYSFVERQITDPEFFNRPGAYYTLSYDIRTGPLPAGYTVRARFDTRNPGGAVYAQDFESTGDTGERWVRRRATMEMPDREPQRTTLLNIGPDGSTSSVPAEGIWFEIRNFKLERGNRATDWTPAPEDAQIAIDALVTKADDLTTGLSNAATQKDYNDLNTRLWGGQGEINKLQSDINANNQAFQTWQKTINDQQKKWNDASTNASAALARFAITQSQWNDISGKATNANTKAIASHAALFEGQHKWNVVAAAAIQTQADFATKQLEWNAVQKKVNDNFGRWQSAAQEMLDTSGKFQALQTQFNSDQKKWNASQLLVNDTQKGINALNTKTGEANTQALAAHQRILKMAYPTPMSLVPMVPGGVNVGTAANPVYDTMPTWLAASSRYTVNGQAGMTDKRSARYSTVATVRPDSTTVPVNVAEIGFSFWVNAAAAGTHMVITLCDENGKRCLAETKIPEGPFAGTIPGKNGSVLGGYLFDTRKGNTIPGATWFKVEGTAKLDPGTTAIRVQEIYFNITPGGTTTQYLTDLQIWPLIPSQASVDKAQNDALDALNRFAIDQAEWNRVSTEAANALAAGQSAQEELGQKRTRWENGATLAINNLQTTSTKFQQWTNGATLAINNLQSTSTKFKQWTDGATLALANLQSDSAKFKQWTKAAADAITAGETANAAQGKAIAALTEIIGVEGDKGQEGSLTHRISLLETTIPEDIAGLQGQISKNTEWVWSKHQWIRSSGLNLPSSKYFSVTGGAEQITVTAVGNWIGSFTIIASTNDGNSLQDWRNVSASVRAWTINKPSGFSGIWDRATLDYSITPGEAVNLSSRSTTKTELVAGGYRTLWQHTVPVTTTINASLNVGWHAATHNYRYGIRIRAGSGTILAEDGPRTGVGPLFLLGDGYRNMNRRVSGRTITAGTTIYFEASVSAGGVDQRTVRDFTANINYIK